MIKGVFGYRRAVQVVDRRYALIEHAQEFSLVPWRPVLERAVGKSVSGVILTDALTAWLERKAGNELDQRFGPRLDRQSRTAERLERKVDALTEILGLFVQHQLTLVAHQPAFDPETAQLGRLRYQRFMELVERRLGKTVEPERLPAANNSKETK